MKSLHTGSLTGRVSLPDSGATFSHNPTLLGQAILLKNKAVAVMRGDVVRRVHGARTGVLKLANYVYEGLASIRCASRAPMDWLNRGSSEDSSTENVSATPGSRSRVHHAKRQIPDEESQAFLKEQRVVHVGTKDASGWPYVVPLVYVYEGDSLLYFHTGDHREQFESNVEHDARVCVEVSKIGALHQGKPYACNSSLEYTSVIAFGTVRLINDSKMKAWFFDRLLAKYGGPGWTFEPGYPLLGQINLYELEMEVLSGKNSHALGH